MSQSKFKVNKFQQKSTFTEREAHLVKLLFYIFHKSVVFKFETHTIIMIILIILIIIIIIIIFMTFVLFDKTFVNKKRQQIET